jgi:hypothetical protein
VAAPTGASEPGQVYAERHFARSAAVARLARREARLSFARGAVFLSGGLAWYLAVGPEVASPWWIAAAAAAFGVLAAVHEATIRKRVRAERAVAFYARGLARLADDWAGAGDDGGRFAEASHPYADDLDLFGPGSLFQRIDSAQTEAGKQTLATWLSGPASGEEILRRQAAVAELRPRVSFREELALLGGDEPRGLACRDLSRWAAGPPVAVPRGLRPLACVLSAGVAAGLVGWLGLGWGSLPFLAAIALELSAVLPWRPRIGDSVSAVASAGSDARALGRVMVVIESERFESPRLAAASDQLESSPSKQLERLARLVDLIESRRNLFFAPVAALLLWDLHLAFAVESWRARLGGRVAGWLAALGDVEALASIAGYAFECPDQPAAQLLDDGGRPTFSAEELGHPLLPAGELVRNDVELGTDCALLVVSGSNMSGKSTLLRAVGANAVLALAGCPVRARSLRLTPLAVGASIRIHDSLQEGRSRFYAEIRRLRQLLDLGKGPRPLLFLLDEVLHGTNSADRRRGAEAILRAFLQAGAIGLVTTHDLSLAEIPASLDERARNVHFEDHLEDGEVRFDYRMRSGVVEKSNAIQLMRAMGLLAGPDPAERLTRAADET